MQKTRGKSFFTLKLVKRAYLYVIKFGNINESNIVENGIVKGDTVLDVIEDSVTDGQKQNNKVADVLLNDFHTMLNFLGREDLKYETEEEIVARKALEEKQKIETENVKLKQENLDLKTRFMKVRAFMTERCAKIPFFGKRLLNEMKKELGEGQLQAGTKENEDMER